MSNLINHSIGRYHILDQLGQGGMATVYKAYDTRLETTVAVKVIRTEMFAPVVLERILKRFDREAKLTASLNHVNIVKVIDYGEHDGQPYLVMPNYSGRTLKQYLDHPMNWQKALELIIPIADALAYAHKRGSIHRDVKPSNILITDSGQPVLTDFGIAKILDIESGVSDTPTGSAVGTPEYMSPEQGLGEEVDGGSDIYSLGIVLYELITGRKPYEAETPPAVLIKQLHDPLPRPSKYVKDLPEEVENILFKALAIKRENRYENLEAFTSALKKPLQNKIEGEGDIKVSSDGEETRDDLSVNKQPGNVQQNSRLPNWLVPMVGGAIGLVLIGTMVLLLVFGLIFPWLEKRVNAQSTPILTTTLEVRNSTPSDLIPSGSIISPTIYQEQTPSSGFQEVTEGPETNQSTQDPSHSGLGEYVDMIYIRGGSFFMGASEEDMYWHLETCKHYAACDIVDYKDMMPMHEVSLDPYYIDIHEVTNGQYRQCVDSGICQPPAQKAISEYLQTDYYSNTRYNDYPVIGIEWQDASEYCNWANEKRLPTEAEWENAAKSGDDLFYPWVRRSDGYTALSVFNGPQALANFCDTNCPMTRWKESKIDDGWAGPAPVMSFPASPNGLYNMAGNVTEWLQDYYDENFYSTSPKQNPVNLIKSTFNLTRGGGWNNGIYHISSVQRNAQAPDNPKAFIGFRCVKEPE